MVLEATIICLDNSEFMRNGDYNPSRMEAQRDAANLLCGTKTQSHPESTVGVLTMAGKSPMVQVALSSDLGKLLSSVSSTQIEGASDFHASIQIAQLALKHRQNKNQKQRIVAFVGSPIETEQKKLVRLGKKLKKNNVAVDVINFGEEAINTEKLEAFINAVNSNDNSHIVTIPPGPHILSDILLSSPIVEGEGGRTGGFMDEEEDPELAMALRLSLEESQRAQGQGQAQAQESSGAQAEPEAGGVAPMEDEDEDLRRALEMSMQEAGMSTAESHNQEQNMEDLDEEKQLEMALKMSQESSKQQPQQQQSTEQQKDESIDEVLQDEEFLGNLVDSLKKGDKKKDQDKEQ